MTHPCECVCSPRLRGYKWLASNGRYGQYVVRMRVFVLIRQRPQSCDTVSVIHHFNGIPTLHANHSHAAKESEQRPNGLLNCWWVQRHRVNIANDHLNDILCESRANVFHFQVEQRQPMRCTLGVPHSMGFASNGNKIITMLRSLHSMFNDLVLGR